MINTSKPTTSIVNSIRASSAELWSTIQTTWASETRTWAQCASFMANTTKHTSTMTNTAKP